MSGDADGGGFRLNRKAEQYIKTVKEHNGRYGAGKRFRGGLVSAATAEETDRLSIAKGGIVVKKIPKKVRDILDKRAKAAKEFIACDNQLVDWLREQNVDLTHPDLQDHILTGCASLIDPEASSNTIIDFLKNW